MATKTIHKDGPVPAMIKALEQFQNKSGQWFSELFNNFLDHCLFMCSVGKLGKQQEDPIFQELFQLLGECSPFEDTLGPLYEAINSRFKASAMGQFFTPDPVSKFMAQIVIDPEEGRKRSLNFMEPTCGSGAMVLAAAQMLHDTRHKHRFWAADLDLMCVKMCAIQCVLNSIPAFIYHMDSLSLEIWRVFVVKLTLIEGHWIPCLIELQGDDLEWAKGVMRTSIKSQPQPTQQPIQEHQTPDPIQTPTEPLQTSQKPRKGANPNQTSLF